METPDETPATITGEHTTTLVVKAPPAGSGRRATAKVLFPVALLIAVAVFAGPVYSIARHLNRGDMKLDCRNNIGNLYQAWQGQLLVDQSKGLVASFTDASDEDGAVIVKLVQRDQGVLAKLTPLKADAVSLCNVDPHYALPADLQLPKESP